MAGERPSIGGKPKPKVEPEANRVKVEGTKQSTTEHIVSRISSAREAYKGMFGCDIKPPVVDVEVSEVVTETVDGKVLWDTTDTNRQVEVKVRFRMIPDNG